MARHSNIVSFDDAKEASRRRRMQESAEELRLRTLSAGPIRYDLSRFAGPDPAWRAREDTVSADLEERAADQVEMRGSGRRNLRTAWVEPDKSERRVERESGDAGAWSLDGQGIRGETAERRSFAALDLRSVFSGRATSSARIGRGELRSRGGFDERDYFDEYDEFDQYGEHGFDIEAYGDESQAASSRFSRATRAESRERRRRERSKERASKMYDRQFAGEASISSAGEAADGAPRAAIYEGKMGSTHRRSARMQRASEASPVLAKIDPAGWLSSLPLSSAQMKIGTAVLCLVLAVVFLYTPAQHYYQSVREHDRLAVEFASIEERNAALAAQNKALASNAGMEDAVRQKYGYVIGGEETAVVTGLSDEVTESRGDGVEANVLSSSIKAPEEWYTPYLDALFGVS